MALRIGIVGLGHWGPNYLRLFSAMENAAVVACADSDPARHAKLKRLHPSVRFSTEAREILQAKDIEAVVLATPTTTHYELARQALAEGKHLLVEKPLTVHSEEAQALADLARKNDRRLMVGHTFLYNPAVQALREIVRKGELGHILYSSAVRTNLGPIRQDVNALLDLAPHDISILLYLLEQMPETVAATGAGYLNPKNEDTVFLTLRFPRSVLAQVHVSWLEPVKVRRLTVIGDRKMAVFNDIDAMEPIRIFDKGVTMAPRAYSNFEEFQAIIREGDVVIPRIPIAEPLQRQCAAFIQAVEEGQTPASDAIFGLRVVQVLEGAMQSLRAGGQPMPIRQTAVRPA